MGVLSMPSSTAKITGYTLHHYHEQRVQGMCEHVPRAATTVPVPLPLLQALPHPFLSSHTHHVPSHERALHVCMPISSRCHAYASGLCTLVVLGCINNILVRLPPILLEVFHG